MKASQNIKFQGSTSIKKVLPVLAPDLDYAGLDVASGTDAMEAWKRLIGLPAGTAKDKLRASILKYCYKTNYLLRSPTRMLSGPFRVSPWGINVVC